MSSYVAPRRLFFRADSAPSDPMTPTSSKDANVVVIGAGPAGLTAAYLLRKAGRSVVVLEADLAYVGGLSRTVCHDGYRVDVGGHRFFSKSVQVNQLWKELLPDDFLERKRLSRIYYRKHYFSYPLRPGEALRRLGIVEVSRCLASYLRARLRPRPTPRTFEDWVVNQFGSRLYEIFFKTYTEKVWGVDCSKISSDWAAQRIKTFSLASALSHAFLPFLRERSPVTTLIRSFKYPKLGPGMLWETCARRITQSGGEVRMGCRATRLEFRKDSWLVEYEDSSGAARSVACKDLISSAALKDIVQNISPPLPDDAVAAARELKYRNYLIVALIVRGPALFEDQWIYVHDPDVQVGRIQNFRAWSPAMVPDEERECYGLEYFCASSDAIWTWNDARLLDLAKREFAAIFPAAPRVVGGFVTRQARAYPVYSLDYRDSLRRIRSALDRHVSHLHLVGRNGMHRYNNQDHSMMTAVLTVENILAGRALFDPWEVNADALYHETQETGGLVAPMPVSS